jgi:xylose dehydrogenase (NAD/NADP)
MSQTRKLRIGILSTARIGANHVIPAIHQSKNAVVVAVASRDLKRAQEFAKANNIAKAYGSYEELFTDAEVDAVYNPLPNHLHLPLALQCLAAGKAQLCEKPLTLDAKEAQQMVDAYAKANVLLAEAFMYRFHPQTDKVVELVRSGAIGTVKTASASFGFNIQDEDDIRMKREWGGGALWDVGTYTTNLVRMIFNASPIDVCAYANFGAKSQCDENVVAIMKFADGGLAHFDCSFRSQLTQTYDIKGTKGRIFVERAFVPFMPGWL